MLDVDARGVTVFDLPAVDLQTADNAGKAQVQVGAQQDIEAAAVQHILDHSAGGIMPLLEIAGRHGDVFAGAGRAARHRPTERLGLEKGVGFAAHDPAQKGLVVSVCLDREGRAILGDGSDLLRTVRAPVFRAGVDSEQIGQDVLLGSRGIGQGIVPGLDERLQNGGDGVVCAIGHGGLLAARRVYHSLNTACGAIVRHRTRQQWWKSPDPRKAGRGVPAPSTESGGDSDPCPPWQHDHHLRGPVGGRSNGGCNRLRRSLGRS